MGKVKIDIADKLFSLWVRNRDGWTCQRCETTYKPPTMALHCSHFQGRGKESTRFEPMNADSLCYGCHQFFTSHPQEHMAWQIERKGQPLIDALRIKANSYTKKDRKAQKLIWRERLMEDFGIKA